MERRGIRRSEKDFLSFVDRKIMEEKYKRNFHNIEVKMNSLNIRRGINYKVKDFEVITRYMNGEAIGSISDSLNVDFSAVKNFLVRNQINIRRTTKKYQFNEDYFNRINSEESAYFLGFLYADGCNVEYESKIVITIHKQDAYILEKFKQFLELDKPQKFTKAGYAHLLINSPIISKDLAKLGCINNKSLILKFPTKEQVPSHLIHHFMR